MPPPNPLADTLTYSVERSSFGKKTT